MQSTAVQMRTRGIQNLKTEASENVKMNGANAEFTDPFLQIIMSLLTQPLDMQQTDSTVGVESSTELNQLNGLAALFQNSPAEMTAFLSTLLNGESNADTVLNSADAGNMAKLMGVADAAAENGILANINILPSLYSEQTAQQPNMTEVLSFFVKNQGNAAKTPISSDALAQLTNLLGLSGRDELQAALKNANVEISSGEAVQVQSGLSEAILKAKEMLSSSLSQQKDDSGDIDADIIQNELAKSSATMPFELRFKTTEDNGNVKLLEQLTDGIKQNVSSGKSEFTIKLKPEALGEITVKLIEEAGKTTLSITTASAQTAKLINNDLNALKQAVAPMNVEVNNAVVSTNETASGSMQQFNMSGQQFAGQQFAGQQSFFQMSQIASRQTDSQLTEDVYASSQLSPARVLSSERLDTYI